KNLGRSLQQLQDFFVALGRVFELSDYEPKIINKENAVKFPEFKEGLHFENVNFEYKKDLPVLKNINLNVKKGETLAIVGNSGGGKSTIASLVPRFYDIKSGSITFDNVDVRDIDLADLRNNIAMVFQDNFLFAGTIKENILLGNPDASEEELMNAVNSAHLQDMIAELPDGINTELTERGVTLSGGQRQRVAIARAMIKNAPIIILDEATSALDNESEAIVQLALDNLIKDKTVLLIAHRFTTIKNADRIAVVNEGELVELGTHEELMQIENGEYKHLYEMQFNKKEENTEVTNE
ncbi:ATP-binding cassette domain-containing protein, partial [bacterium]|nr:ATP-binding cassette domain-containing protein [bacterium]